MRHTDDSRGPSIHHWTWRCHAVSLDIDIGPESAVMKVMDIESCTCDCDDHHMFPAKCARSGGGRRRRVADFVISYSGKLSAQAPRPQGHNDRSWISLPVHLRHLRFQHRALMCSSASAVIFNWFWETKSRLYKAISKNKRLECKTSARRMSFLLAQS